MHKINFWLPSLSFIAAAGLVLVCPFSGNTASPSSAFKTFSDRQFVSAMAVGPGLNNLSAADNYSSYQWGFKNDGDLHMVEIRQKFDNISEKYKNVADPSGLIGLPRTIGPGSYERVKTNAVAGIDINLLPAWELYQKAENKREVIVAIVDTGIDITHPDLKEAIWINSDEIPGDGIDNDNNGFTDDVNGWNFFNNTNQVYMGAEDDHGTHVAGTISASHGNGGIVGITDNTYVKIMPLKALGTASGTGTPEMIIAAIKYAEANGASICNLSSGTLTAYPELNQAIADSGMLFIAAAGNGDVNDIGYSLDDNPVYPAALPYDNVISVANLLFNGTLAESSNYGASTVDIAAPGSYIVSTIPGGGYGMLSGTSMAAPMVTGTAAMLYSTHPDWSVTDIKKVILNSSRKLDALTGKIKCGGMLDAAAAMEITFTN